MGSSAPREELSSPLLFPAHDDGHGLPLQASTSLPPVAADGKAHGTSGKLESILNGHLHPLAPPRRACLPDRDEAAPLPRGAGHNCVPNQLRHVHVHPDLLRSPRQRRARRRLPRQHRHPNLRLWHHDRIDCPQLGMGSAVETLCGQAYGAHKYEMLGVSLQRSTVLLMATGVPLAVIYALSRPILVLLGESRDIARAASVFVYGLIPQIFAYAANFPIQKFLQAQSIVAPSAYISAATLVVHLLLSWVVVYKVGLGLLGASLVLSLSWCIIVGAQFVYIVTSRLCRSTWTGFTWQAFSGLPGFFRLTTASAVMPCLETWYYQILMLITGLLKDPALALDSLSVCMGINTGTFMISVGFNAAASVRVSNELGAGNPKSAAFSVVVVTAVSFAVSVVAAMIVLCLRNYISYIFTEGETVARAVSDLCPLLAAAIVLNGIQPVLSGVAVGCGWQAFVAYVNVGCYYIVGVPAGCLLGFKFGLGVKGIWCGLIAGTVIQTLILLVATFRTDWNKEVEEAKKRLDKWEDKEEPLLS